MNKLTLEDAKCKCCQGTGIQKNKDMLNVYCPACRGSGESPYYNENIKFQMDIPKFSIKKDTLFC